MPPDKNTADQSEPFCTRIEISVTVSGVEYLSPRREETNAAAYQMAVIKARTWGDMNRKRQRTKWQSADNEKQGYSQFRL